MNLIKEYAATAAIALIMFTAGLLLALHLSHTLLRQTGIGGQRTTLTDQSLMEQSSDKVALASSVTSSASPTPSGGCGCPACCSL